jgi:uncharacterized membrane protein YgcG
MSSRALLIVGIVGATLAGIALFAVALAVVAIDGSSLSGQVMAMLVLAALLGLVLDATWLCLAVDRLSKRGHGGDGEDGGGGEGGGGPGSDPACPQSPFGDPESWLEFERELCVHRERREREPAAR